MARLLYDVLAAHQLWLETDDKCGAPADLTGADLNWVYLGGASLNGANLRGTDLNGANLRGTDLRGANLTGANLTEANLDFSSGIPFHCGGTGAIGDKRLFAQMIYHLTRQDWSQAGPEVAEELARITSANWFCAYRSDVKEV